MTGGHTGISHIIHSNEPTDLFCDGRLWFNDLKSNSLCKSDLFRDPFVEFIKWKSGLIFYLANQIGDWITYWRPLKFSIDTLNKTSFSTSVTLLETFVNIQNVLLYIGHKIEHNVCTLNPKKKKKNFYNNYFQFFKSFL